MRGGIIVKYVEPEMEIVEFDKSEVFTVSTSGLTDNTKEDEIHGSWD